MDCIGFSLSTAQVTLITARIIFNEIVSIRSSCILTSNVFQDATHVGQVHVEIEILVDGLRTLHAGDIDKENENKKQRISFRFPPISTCYLIY